MKRDLVESKLTDFGTRITVDDPKKIGGLRVQGSVITSRASEIQVRIDGERDSIWIESILLENITPVFILFIRK